MKVRMKIESRWIEHEKKSMEKVLKDYESWELETLQKARDAKDLRELREIFYKLGDRWEFDQVTGEWLSSGEPLDAVGLILKMPGLTPNKERYVVYSVMAYSKGLTDQFDHLGDKERIIIEHDKETGDMRCWSTTGHGAMDLFSTSLSSFDSLEDILENCYLVAQPGDHAMRIECPGVTKLFAVFAKKLWTIAGGDIKFSTKEIDLLSVEDMEKTLDFQFHRYAKAVIDLERSWQIFTGRVIEKAKELVVDEIPDHIEKRNKQALRKVEGLLNVLWFRPPAYQISSVRKLYDELKSEPTPTNVQSEITPRVGELLYALDDIIEKAKYLKWKSVIDSKSFSESDLFRGLEISDMEKEAIAVAIDDILREHTLAYIGYPERARVKDKILRVILGIAVLPARLVSAFSEAVKKRIRSLRKGSDDNGDSDDASSPKKTILPSERETESVSD